jgi:hypothetical protein
LSTLLSGAWSSPVLAYELLICTRKGLLIGRSNADRSQWELGAPQFLGQQVDFARRDLRDGRIWVSTAHMQWGPHLFYSDDDGEGWVESEAARFEGETFAASPYEFASRQDLTWDNAKEEWSPRHELAASLDRIWTIVPGPASEPDQLLLGVSPAGIFRSSDRGRSWDLPPGRAPSRRECVPDRWETEGDRGTEWWMGDATGMRSTREAPQRRPRRRSRGLRGNRPTCGRAHDAPVTGRTRHWSR